jgi:hypothetical protein
MVIISKSKINKSVGFEITKEYIQIYLFKIRIYINYTQSYKDYYTNSIYSTSPIDKSTSGMDYIVDYFTSEEFRKSFWEKGIELGYFKDIEPYHLGGVGLKIINTDSEYLSYETTFMIGTECFSENKLKELNEDRSNIQAETQKRIEENYKKLKWYDKLFETKERWDMDK